MLLASPFSFFSFVFLGVLPHIHDHHHYILYCYEALNKQSCSWTASFRVADSTIMVFCICIYTHVAIIDTLNSTICCRQFDIARFASANRFLFLHNHAESEAALKQDHSE
jgi:hypothetical protein